jgi:mannose-6-phosphate isomerase class I
MKTKFLQIIPLLTAIIVISCTEKSSNNIITLKPILVNKVWGMPDSVIKKIDSYLSSLNTDKSENIGEYWFGYHPNHPDISIKKILLDTLRSKKILGDNTYDSLYHFYPGHLPILMKYLTSSEVLSLHYHWLPSEIRENTFETDTITEPGKVEIWYIRHVEENSGIFIGIKDGIKSKDFLNRFIELNKTARKENRGLSNSEIQGLRNMMNFIPVKEGDVVTIKPGVPHSIGENVSMIEIMHNSSSLVRVTDWERQNSKRDVLLDTQNKSFSSIDYDLMDSNSTNINDCFSHSSEGKIRETKGGSITPLVENFYGLFVYKVCANKIGVNSADFINKNYYSTILYSSGEEEIVQEGDYTSNPNRGFMIAAGTEYTIKSSSNKQMTEVIVAWIVPKGIWLK